jgi:hypothetical protein
MPTELANIFALGMAEETQSLKRIFALNVSVKTSGSLDFHIGAEAITFPA